MEKKKQDELTQDLEDLYARLDTIEVPEPSEKMDREFYRSLDLVNATRMKRRPGPRSLITTWFTNKKSVQFAAAVALVAFGWLLGSIGNTGKYNQKINTMSRELKQMKEVMLVTMLQQPSATKRIKAISYADDFENADDRILNAFLKTLNNDPNPNVRLTAVEALSRYSDIRFVREGLIRSINAQESPLVQVALIELMGRLGEKKARPELQKLLQNRDLNFSVRNKTRETMKLL